ncbi:MAG: dTDP-4-dehydrorhamnose 3,5-epimerase [Methylophilaceae bacterium]|nr:dTDP-4-dehydrorhamnose 3,5-epimerase [Methylophilaceae bacterium]
MKAIPLVIPDVKIIEIDLFNDERGFFFESYNNDKFSKAVNRNVNFIQDNHSKSKKGVIRGLHYQVLPYEQAKLIRVVSGEIFDVAFDIRHNSPTYGHYVTAILSSENKRQLWVPEGFAHGFQILTDYAEVIYKVNNAYSIFHEKTINPFDKEININWPIKSNVTWQDKKMFNN